MSVASHSTEKAPVLDPLTRSGILTIPSPLLPTMTAGTDTTGNAECVAYRIWHPVCVNVPVSEYVPCFIAAFRPSKSPPAVSSATTVKIAGVAALPDTTTFPLMPVFSQNLTIVPSPIVSVEPLGTTTVFRTTYIFPDVHVVSPAKRPPTITYRLSLRTRISRVSSPSTNVFQPSGSAVVFHASANELVEAAFISRPVASDAPNVSQARFSSLAFTIGSPTAYVNALSAASSYTVTSVCRASTAILIP